MGKKIGITLGIMLPVCAVAILLLNRFAEDIESDMYSPRVEAEDTATGEKDTGFDFDAKWAEKFVKGV